MTKVFEFAHGQRDELATGLDVCREIARNYGGVPKSTLDLASSKLGNSESSIADSIAGNRSSVPFLVDGIVSNPEVPSS